MSYNVDIYGFRIIKQSPVHPPERSYVRPVPIKFPDPAEVMTVTGITLDEVVWQWVDQVVPVIKSKIPGWQYSHHTFQDV